MDRREFRLRLAQKPHSVRFEELERLLELYDWVQERRRGSHVVFRRANETIVVPYRRPNVLAIYVRKALECTEEDDA